MDNANFSISSFSCSERSCIDSNFTNAFEHVAKHLLWKLINANKQ